MASQSDFLPKRSQVQIPAGSRAIILHLCVTNIKTLQYADRKKILKIKNKK
jgi:hypothetical protein